jgi:large subunit ribosomal protein L21
MLAIVKIAGQQFKVKAGDSLYVPHIEGKAGDSVEFSDVLITHNGGYRCKWFRCKGSC